MTIQPAERKSSDSMECQGANGGFNAKTEDTYTPNNGDGGFVQSLLQSPGADVLDY